MARLVECNRCGRLAVIQTVRPIYEDSETVASAQIIGVEQDIDCPDCGVQTQAVLDADCPA